MLLLNKRKIGELHSLPLWCPLSLVNVLLLKHSELKGNLERKVTPTLVPWKRLTSRSYLRLGLFEEATFNQKEKLPPGPISPWLHWNSYYPYILSEWSRYRLGKCTVSVPRNFLHDFFYSPYNSQEESMLSPGEKKKHSFVSKKDNSLIFWGPTNSMISFPSVFPLHLTLVKNLSKHEKRENSVKTGRAWNNTCSVVGFSGSIQHGKQEKGNAEAWRSIQGDGRLRGKIFPEKNGTDKTHMKDHIENWMKNYWRIGEDLARASKKKRRRRNVREKEAIYSKNNQQLFKKEKYSHDTLLDSVINNSCRVIIKTQHTDLSKSNKTVFWKLGRKISVRGVVQRAKFTLPTVRKK